MDKPLEIVYIGRNPLGDRPTWATRPLPDYRPALVIPDMTKEEARAALKNMLLELGVSPGPCQGIEYTLSKIPQGKDSLGYIGRESTRLFYAAVLVLVKAALEAQEENNE